MKETIKKVIYNKLCTIPNNKVILWPDLQVAFDVATGKSLNDYLDEVDAVVEELEAAQFARFEQSPNKMIRVFKGVDFDKWSNSMKPSQNNSQININSLTAHNVQVGNENTMNINITPEQFVEALSALIKNQKKANSIIDELSSYLKKGVSLAEVIAKFVTLMG